MRNKKSSTLKYEEKSMKDKLDLLLGEKKETGS